MVWMISSERPLMFNAEQYRAKALEYGNLVATSADADEKREYQKLQQKFAELADNDEWLAGHRKQTLHVADVEYSGGTFLATQDSILQSQESILQSQESIPQNKDSDNAPLAQEEEHILRCLGAALIMQWGSLPQKLQRELFDNAGAMGDLLDTASLRGQIARFLHKTNSDLH
jgi:hypothetical protein